MFNACELLENIKKVLNKHVWNWPEQHKWQQGKLINFEAHLKSKES